MTNKLGPASPVKKRVYTNVVETVSVMITGSESSVKFPATLRASELMMCVSLILNQLGASLTGGDATAAG